MAKNLKGQIGISFLWVIFLLFLTFVICAFILNTVLPIFPLTPNAIANQGLTGIRNYVNYTFTFADNSFYVLFILVLFIGLYDAYENPSRKKAVFDIIGIFVIGYFNLAITGILGSLGALNPSVSLPLTYVFFDTAYKVIILYFVMIIAIILNMRSK